MSMAGWKWIEGMLACFLHIANIGFDCIVKTMEGLFASMTPCGAPWKRRCTRAPASIFLLNELNVKNVRFHDMNLPDGFLYRLVSYLSKIYLTRGRKLTSTGNYVPPVIVRVVSI